MVRAETLELYGAIMKSEGQLKLKEQVILNLKNMLLEEEERAREKSAQPQKNNNKNNEKHGGSLLTTTTTPDLTEIGDADSGICGIMLATIETEIRNSAVSAHLSLRHASFSVLRLMLRQGLAHPMKCVPHLVALSTDSAVVIQKQAQQQLLCDNRTEGPTQGSSLPFLPQPLWDSDWSNPQDSREAHTIRTDAFEMNPCDSSYDRSRR